MEITDRYKALGIPYPDPKTMCPGQCEGVGRFPVYMNEGDHLKYGVRPEAEKDPELIVLWRDAERDSPCDDGWHFVKCPTCGGTGKRKE